MPLQCLLAGGARELPIDREPAAADVVGDPEQLHGGAEILRLNAELARPALAETQCQLLPVRQSAFEAGGLPNPPAAPPRRGDPTRFRCRPAPHPVPLRRSPAPRQRPP